MQLASLDHAVNLSSLPEVTSVNVGGQNAILAALQHAVVPPSFTTQPTSIGSQYAFDTADMASMQLQADVACLQQSEVSLMGPSSSSSIGTVLMPLHQQPDGNNVAMAAAMLYRQQQAEDAVKQQKQAAGGMQALPMLSDPAPAGSQAVLPPSVTSLYGKVRAADPAGLSAVIGRLCGGTAAAAAARLLQRPHPASLSCPAAVRPVQTVNNAAGQPVVYQSLAAAAVAAGQAPAGGISNLQSFMASPGDMSGDSAAYAACQPASVTMDGSGTVLGPEYMNMLMSASETTLAKPQSLKLQQALDIAELPGLLSQPSKLASGNAMLLQQQQHQVCHMFPRAGSMGTATVVIDERGLHPQGSNAAGAGGVTVRHVPAVDAMQRPGQVVLMDAAGRVVGICNLDAVSGHESMLASMAGGGASLGPLTTSAVGSRAAAVGTSSAATNTPNGGQNPLYKTERCRSWQDSGSCRYGARCQFAHGGHELRPVIRHPKWKTQPCRTFTLTGSCPYGDRCNFIHDEGLAALRTTSNSSAISAASFGMTIPCCCSGVNSSNVSSGFIGRAASSNTSSALDGPNAARSGAQTSDGSIVAA
eukprot:GHRR01000756.1.p1 GENE.GHRR01000756.1~~GHRR01000756.1.p1  ORF type:complete len:588 (+),score=231.01 GHRR01000756.1:563-2326(+)